MTNVLLPTDFTLTSLDTINKVAAVVAGKLNIFLFHAFDLPDTLIDAMHRTGTNSYCNNLITEELRLKCRQKKAIYPDITQISFRLMYGTTIPAFRNFIDANQIDLLVLPDDHRFIPAVRESVNYERMFRKSGKAILTKIGGDVAADDYSGSIIGPQAALNP